MNHLKYFGNSIYKYRNLPTNVNCILFNLNNILLNYDSNCSTNSLISMFRNNNIMVSSTLIKEKKDSNIETHILNILSEIEINNKWVTFNKTKPNLQTINYLVNEYNKIYENSKKYHFTIKPCIKSIFDDIKQYDILIGLTTNISNNIIIQEFKKKYIKLDSVVYNENINNNSHMIYQNMINLNIETINSVIKVDNNIQGIKQGINAGCWTVGIYEYDTNMYENTIEKENIEQKTRNRLIHAGADFVIPNLSYLPEVIEKINSQMDVNRLII